MMSFFSAHPLHQLYALAITCNISLSGYPFQLFTCSPRDMIMNLHDDTQRRVIKSVRYE
jgi:hypothetical protein